ncbi:MAG: phosphodiester glycosidase family protein [Candidatus Eremiobacteraeota bacterium]|nr:phosphodiester glycosidase family protein [Candidatus Eremiobacteraeota bacterium]
MSRFTPVLSAGRFGTRGRLLVGLAVAVALAIAIVAGIFAREPLERAALTAGLRGATGYAISLDRVSHANGGLVLSGFHARSQGGAIVVDAARIAIVRGAGRLRLDVYRPHVAVLPDRLRGNERTGLLHAAEGLHVYDVAIDARVREGSAVLASGEIPVVDAAFVGVAGNVRLSEHTLQYDLHAALREDDGSYPIVASARSAGYGPPAIRWTATRLPVVPFARAIPPDAQVRVTGGTLSEVTVSNGPSGVVRFDAQLSGGDIEFANGALHEVRDLHGDVALSENAYGSSGLKGTLDGVPLEIAGEARGLRDLRALARLAVAAEGEPALTGVRLEATAPGVAYTQFAFTTEHGPLAVSLVLIDPRETTLHFNTAIAEDRVNSGGERTSAMGVRTKAVAGVNGDYFDIGRSYAPQGMLIRDGEIVRGPTDRYALVIRRDNSVEFGEYRMHGSAKTGHGTFALTQVNNWPAGRATVITPAFGKTLPPAKGVTFVALTALDGAGTYLVSRVVPATEPIPAEFGLAFGPLVTSPLPRVGEKVIVKYALDPAVDGAVAGIGGGPLLLKDGQWYEDKHAPAPDERDVRWPVVGLAKLQDDFLAFVAVDGRHPERSVGMTRPEFADLLRLLGASDAMALDSGGSVTLVSRAPGDANVSVRNVPSDSSAERWVSDALFLYSSAPPPALVLPRTATTPVPEKRPEL